MGTIGVRPTIVINAQACTGCEACLDSCPTDVIRMNRKSRKAMMVYGEDCQGCFLCEIDCPVGAIKVQTRKWFRV
jgi:NAD-dependent dihydropyrimidine dehydrogenase PreA subunit